MAIKDLTALTPQADLILEYLQVKEGRKITPLEAHVSLGVASLTARIAELRRHGYVLSDKWEEDHFNRRYKSYWLQTKAEADEKAKQSSTPRQGVGETGWH